MISRYLILLSLAFLFCLSSCRRTTADNADLSIVTTDKALKKNFDWAKEKALNYLTANKRDNINYGQMSATHLLGMQKENLEKLQTSASTANEKNGVLVVNAYRQYLWTGDRKIITDPTLWNAYTRIVTDSVISDEESLSGNASEKHIFNAYAAMLYARGEYAESENYRKKAEQIKDTLTILSACGQYMVPTLTEAERHMPETPFLFISYVVENLIGFEPDAPNHAFSTILHLPTGVERLGVNNIILGKHKVNVLHEGNRSTIIKHVYGGKDVQCTLRFYGNYSQISIDNTLFMATPGMLNGKSVSQVCITIPSGSSIHARAIE